MGAECHIHGCDLGGDTHSGLRCPVCEKEKEIQSLEARATRAEEERDELLRQRDSYHDWLKRAAEEGDPDVKRMAGSALDALERAQVEIRPHPLASRLREVEGELARLTEQHRPCATRILVAEDDLDVTRAKLAELLGAAQALLVAVDVDQPNITDEVEQLRGVADKLSEGGER